VAGYSSVQATTADIAKVYPSYADWLHGRQASDILAEVHRRICRRRWRICREDGPDITQLSNASDLVQAEVYLFLALLFEGQVVPDTSGDLQPARTADFWDRRFERELDAVRLEYDSSVSLPSDTTERTEVQVVFYRGA
jgi:hypothetical protein